MEFIEFWTLCSANGIVLDEQQREQIQRYTKELLYWNAKVNMISRKDEENIWVRHIMHSLAPLKYVDIPFKSNCLDIGSGGGLPGIPIAIASNQIKMLLTDSIKKKVKMMAMFADHSGVKHLKARQVRVEELSREKEYKSSFDYIFARGVARAEKLFTWTDKLLKPQGQWILLKGGDLSEEIEEARAAHPKIDIKEIKIDFFGVDWFAREDKKLLICSRRK